MRLMLNGVPVPVAAVVPVGFHVPVPEAVPVLEPDLVVLTRRANIKLKLRDTRCVPTVT